MEKIDIESYLLNNTFDAIDQYGNSCTLVNGFVTKRVYNNGFEVKNGEIKPIGSRAQYIGDRSQDNFTVTDLNGNLIKVGYVYVKGQAGPVILDSENMRIYIDADNKIDMLQTKLWWLYEAIKEIAIKESEMLLSFYGITKEISKYALRSIIGLKVIYDANNSSIIIKESNRTILSLKGDSDIIETGDSNNYMIQPDIRIIDDLASKLRYLEIDLDKLCKDNNIDMNKDTSDEKR